MIDRDVFDERALGDLDCFGEYLAAFAKVFLKESGGCWPIFMDECIKLGQEEWANWPCYSITNWWGLLREN